MKIKLMKSSDQYETKTLRSKNEIHWNKNQIETQNLKNKEWHIPKGKKKKRTYVWFGQENSHC